MYPEKDDYVKWFENKDDPDHKIKMDVAAYLLKSKYYRKNYLEWIGGNDTNSITESGLEGAGRNILITCNDKRYLIVEGHSRMTIYGFDPTKLDGTYAYVGYCSSRDMKKYDPRMLEGESLRSRKY